MISSYCVNTMLVYSKILLKMLYENLPCFAWNFASVMCIYMANFVVSCFVKIFSRDM